MGYDGNYRISTALADIAKGALFARGIPVPDQPMYSDYSQRVDLNTGGQALRGFSVVTWMWDELLLSQSNDIVALPSPAAAQSINTSNTNLAPTFNVSEGLFNDPIAVRKMQNLVLEVLAGAL